MTSERRVNPALVDLIRVIVQASIEEARSGTRVPTVLSGAIEEVDEDLDLLYVRMDQEAMAGDPTQSLNYELPGVIPATRIGEAWLDEQVRITFDPQLGATANRTSTENVIVLPYGAEEGRRIVFDGRDGTIRFFNDQNELAGFLDPTQWFVGTPGSARSQLDPLAGLRLRDNDDELRALLSATEGLLLREPQSGITGLVARPDGLIVLDPETGERLSITSGTSSALPTPHWTGQVETDPGSALDVPAGQSFGTGNDLALRFAAASDNVERGAQSVTPPAGHTELTDENESADGRTFATASASEALTGATIAADSFTSTSSDWDRSNGHTVSVRGAPGGTAPTVRSVLAGDVLTTTEQTIDFTIDAPAGVAEDDVLLAFVALVGPNIPIAWTVPEGWIQVGTLADGLGTAQILASGVWAFRAPIDPPASETVSINMTDSGPTKLQATVVAIQDAGFFPGGLDIRRNERSMPRGRIVQSVETNATGAINGNNLPTTVNQINNLELKAGRDYRFSFFCPRYDFGSLNTNSRWQCVLRRNGTDFATLFDREMAAGGTERQTLTSTALYTPAADETANWHVQVRNIASGANYSIDLRASLAAPRTLTVTDEGAVFD